MMQLVTCFGFLGLWNKFVLEMDTVWWRVLLSFCFLIGASRQSWKLSREHLEKRIKEGKEEHNGLTFTWDLVPGFGTDPSPTESKEAEDN